MSSDKAILSTAYLPPIQYFTKVFGFDSVILETQETYAKQSYRNRCVILSCNGPLSLTIPVVKADGNNTSIRNIEIDYSLNWRKNHWKAIESAYKTSIYYDFVSDMLIPFYSRKEKYLFDFNFRLIEDILVFLNKDKQIHLSGDYIKQYQDGTYDFRNTIHPKPQFQVDDNSFYPAKYFQVFSDRFDFRPNLSIVDLLFNEGLNSMKIIEASTIKNLP